MTMTGVLAPEALDVITEHWQGRPTFAVVDLDALASNIAALRSIVGPDVVLTSVVKANGYGHGAIPIAKAAAEAGADELAVATVDEGVQLRAAGIETPILVMGAIGKVEAARAIGNRLRLVVSEASFAHHLAAEAKHLHWKDPVSIHLKVDTGMRRFGAAMVNVVDVAKAIKAHEQLSLDGLMTHLSSADDPDPASAFNQLAEFDRAVAMLQEAGIEIPQQHVANSAATLRFPEFHRDRVRSGVAGYGLRPDVGMILPDAFRPILTVHGRVCRIIDLAPGDAVSYGRTYKAKQPERGGLIPIGYGDGYRRSFTSRAHMAIHGHRADVLGRVCMDQTVIRLPDEVDVKLGDLVTIIGNGTPATAGAPTIDDLAELTGTISYELSCGLQARLPKLYIRNGDLVAIADLAGYREL
jgi:alanine racemase